MTSGLFEVLSSKYFQGDIRICAPWCTDQVTHLVFLLGYTENNPKKKSDFGRFFSCYNLPMSKKLLYRAFWAVVAVTSLDFVSRMFYLYWSTRWLDNVSHFLGGVAIGLLTLWFVSLF